MSQIPLILCFPHDDHEFVERVHTLVDGSDPEAPLAAAVQALLRETHPLAIITPRHQLALLAEERVWYAFRDGSVTHTVDGEAS